MSRLETKRRTFLTALAAVPGMNLLAGDRQAIAQETPAGRDVIAELGVRSLINAAGTFTALTASLMPPEVMAAMQVASRKYVRIDDLHDAVGKRIAELLRLPSGPGHCWLRFGTFAVNGGLRGRQGPREDQADSRHDRLKNEVIIQKTHRIGYDHAIRNAGVNMIEVETRRDLELAINDRTAMMFFLNFAKPVGKIHHEEFFEVGRKHNIPTLDRRGGRRASGGEPVAVHEDGLRPGRLLRRQGHARAAVGGAAAGPQRPDRGRADE